MATSRTVLSMIGVAGVVITLALSQTSEPEGHVTTIFHDVQLLPAQADARPAAINDKVDEGSAVRTGADSRSELTFADLTITRLGANTIFSVNKAGRSVQLDSGSILLYAKKNSGGATITTKAVSVGITGTTVIFESRADRYDRLTVLEGDALFSLNVYPDQSTDVRAGELLHVRAGAKKLPKPGHVDLRRLLRTHPLIKNFPPLPSLDLILAAANEQNLNTSSRRAAGSRGPQGGSSPIYVPNPPGRPPGPTYPGPIPTPTAAPLHSPSPRPTPRPTPKPTAKPTPTPHRPTPKPIPTPKKKYPPKRPVRQTPTPKPTQPTIY